MAFYENLKQTKDATIFPNNQNLIDAETHADFLEEVIDKLGALQYRGEALPNDVPLPANHDGPAVYLAKTVGVYPNFSGIEVTQGQICFLKYDGISAWNKDVIIDTNQLGITPVIVATYNASGSVTIPAGKTIDKIVIVTLNGQQEITVTASTESERLTDAELFPANFNYVNSVDLYSHTTDIILDFSSTYPSGQTGLDNIIKIYTR